MIFRDIIYFVLDQRKRLLYVLTNLFVAICQSTAFILGIQSSLRLLHINNTQIILSLLRMIWKTINHGQTIMCIGTAQKRLSFVRKQFLRLAHLLYSLKSGVRSGDRLIVGLPDIHIAFVAAYGAVLPVGHLMIELASVRVLLTHVIDIVRRKFKPAGI